MREDILNDIYTLISLYENTKEAYDAALKELRQKDEILENQKKQIKELEGQIDSLKLKSAFLSASGDEKAKEKIDSLIRKIDRCIALLD